MFLTLAKKFVEFVVYTNIWVGLAVVALTGFTFQLVGRTDDKLLFFVFFATLFMYAYARWFESPSRLDDVRSRLTDWADRNRLVSMASGFIGFIGSIWFAQFLATNTWIWLLLCAALSAVYPWQFMRKSRGLRNVAGVKLFVISLVWSIVTTLLPASQIGEPLDFEMALLTIQRFLFVLAITIPFDIRDLRIDSPELNTLPYTLGIKKSRNLALLAILSVELGAILMYFGQLISVGELVGQILAYELASYFIWRSSPKKPDLFFSFGVEGTSIALFLGVYIFNYFWP